MAELQYTCPGCAAPIEYDINKGKMACKYCLSAFTVEEVEAYSRTHQPPATHPTSASSPTQPTREPTPPARSETPPTIAAEHGTGHWQVNSGTTLSQAEENSFQHLQCNACGAQIVTDPDVISTRCGYCNNTLVAASRMEATRVPDVIIPFALDRDAMITAFRRAAEGKFLLPPKFRNEHVIRQATGMYVPFWLFDGRAEGTMRFTGTRRSSHNEGRYRVTTTTTYDVVREGGIDFKGIPVCGSVQLGRARADAAEPFNPKGIVPFLTPYLSGYAASSYTIPSEETLSVGEARAIASLEDYLTSTLDYDDVTVVDHDVTFSNAKVTYALLPIWLLNIDYRGALYHFTINGQTGEVIGRFPYSRPRLWGMRIGYFLAGLLGGGALVDALFRGDLF